MPNEQEIIKHLLINMPACRRLFRINAGMGWIGKVVKMINKNQLILANPRPFHAAPQGWPDLCGWEEIEITPDMVGKKFARFLGVEVKASGRLSNKQRMMKDVIEDMGGKFEIITEIPDLE